VKQHATSWKCGTQVVSLESPVLVGILNVTPDSFSDGGSFNQLHLAVEHAMQLIEDGATMIDVGGESTRPGATRVSEEEQIARTEPVIKAIKEQNDICISIDTTQAAVALAAIEAGATVINDVAAGEEDDSMLPLAAEYGVGLVLMHRRLPPELDQYSDAYGDIPTSPDIVAEVSRWLESRVEAAIDAGVQREAIAIDPGLGFGKSVEQNWKLIESAHEFVESGHPIYVGASRKSFIGSTFGIESPEMRDTASATTAIEMFLQGVQIFRVHNVLEHARMLQSIT
jgi:dihydropteroate synthase